MGCAVDSVEVQTCISPHSWSPNFSNVILIKRHGLRRQLRGRAECYATSRKSAAVISSRRGNLPTCAGCLAWTQKRRARDV